jgi:FkbM family methyltransferase
MTELRELIVTMPRKFASFISGKGLGKLPLVTTIYGLFYCSLKPSGIVLIDVQGSKMYVDARDVGVAPFLLTWGVYERNETELFKKLLKKGMVVVDVGAHIGYYTLIAAGFVGEEGKVFAFEPDPHNYSLLTKNIEINGFRNVIPLRKAVFSKTRKMKLFLDKSNLGRHSLSETNVDKGASITIEATNLDDYFKGADHKIDIIKLDVQGSEMKVLEGMTSIIKQNENLKIITEFWPIGLRNSGSSPKNFLNKLEEYGFALYQIGQHVELVDATHLLRRFNDEGFTTVLCKKEKN